jgi:hypothetical protein
VFWFERLLSSCESACCRRDTPCFQIDMKKCNGSDRGKMDQRTIKRAGAGKEREVRGGREGKGQRKEEKRESRTRRRRGKRTGKEYREQR